MKFLFALALVAACNAVDLSNPPITPQEISEMIIPAVKAAQAPLNQMVDVEDAEVAEMNDVKQTVDKLEKTGPEPQQALIQEATKRIELDENKAIANEDRQQKMALDSMNKAKQLIKGFHARGVGNNKELGESAKDQPMESALAHIETVEKALEKDTATSHTKEKIQHMLKQSVDVEHQANGAPPEMMAAPGMPGPDGMPMPEKLGEERGAISDLNQQASMQGPGMPEYPEMMAAPGMPGPDGPGMPSAVGLDEPDLMSQLESLKTEEAQVEAAEISDESEVKRLADELN